MPGLNQRAIAVGGKADAEKNRNCYNNNKHDINLVRVLLQHSSIAVTQRYIGIQSEEIEEALQKHVHLI